MLMHKILQNHLLCEFVANSKIGAIYALYPESFCYKKLAIRKVFAFCDSEYICVEFDLVVINEGVKPTRILLVELTVPWDNATNFQAALERKTARYERLTEDLIQAGYDARNLPLEIGCRGVINLRNAAALEYICNQVGIKAIKKLKGALGRIALIGSYRIWLARNSREWNGGELIKVQT